MVRAALRFAVVAAALAVVPGALADGPAARFDAVVGAMLAEPYQPDYVPAGLDSAFETAVPNVAPAEDYTSGSIPGSPDAPAFPAAFAQVLFHSADGAPLFGMLALHPGVHPGVVVAHGFNTHGYSSVVRWAALLYARGYDVFAPDQRDFYWESQAGDGYPDWLQTLGWKESQDVLAAGTYLAAQPGVSEVGVVGFSEGAQNSLLALAQDGGRVFRAGLTFSGPADQNTQLASNIVASDALVALVTPSETTACGALADAAARYGTTGFAILAHETAMHAQPQIRVPFLNVYSADDSLVPAVEARMMEAYAPGHTVELQRGEHAYLDDRWWQQRAILLWFKTWLGPRDTWLGTEPTVNRTPLGGPASQKTVDLGAPSRAWADEQLAPYVCDASQGVPGRS